MSVSVSQWGNKSSLLGVFSLQFDRCWAFLILLCQTKLTLGISLQIKTLRCPPCPGFIMSEHLHARAPSEDDWSVPHPPCCTPLILYLSSYLNTFSIKSEKEGRGMGDPWGRGAERSLCHWRGRERGREGGEKEGGRRERGRERERRIVSHMWLKKHSSAHAGLVCSRDYPSAFRSDGGHAGMNR